VPGQLLDDQDAVRENQRRLAAALGATPLYLHQVHGTTVQRLTARDPARAADAPLPQADASFSTEPGIACAVQVADCLPVLFAARDGRVVGAAHAGWRGLAGGVLERTVAAMCEASGLAPDALQAWLGPCIGPTAFEVGADVLVAFGADPQCERPGERPDALLRFVPRPRADGSPRWLADLPGLARDRLAAVGLHAVYGGRWCTVSEPSRFFSYRLASVTGRMAACIARRA
jgi:YfiH family protein